MLLGIRTGDILEVELECKYVAQDRDDGSEVDPEFQDYEEELESITFNCNLLYRNHSMQCGNEKFELSEHNKQKKLQIAVHPIRPVLATIGSDRFLCFWNSFEHSLLEKRDQTSQPTCIKWSNDGQFLVVGYANGTLGVLQYLNVGSQNDASMTTSR